MVLITSGELNVSIDCFYTVKICLLPRVCCTHERSR